MAVHKVISYQQLLKTEIKVTVSFLFLNLEIILPMHQLAHFGPASRLKSLSPPCFIGGVETVVFFIRIAGINVIKARINIMIRCALM